MTIKEPKPATPTSTTTTATTTNTYTTWVTNTTNASPFGLEDDRLTMTTTAPMPKQPPPQDNDDINNNNDGDALPPRTQPNCMQAICLNVCFCAREGLIQQSKEWLIVFAGCGHSTNVWDAGGIRCAAHGTSKVYGRCPICHKTSIATIFRPSKRQQRLQRQQQQRQQQQQQRQQQVLENNKDAVQQDIYTQDIYTQQMRR